MLLCLCALEGYAQNNGLGKPHELRLSIGASLVPHRIFHEWGLDYHNGYFHNHNYRGHLRGTPAINLGYQYQFKKWLSFGATATYLATWQRQYSSYDNSLLYTDHTHFIGLTPIVRFDWFRSNFVKLYSSIGVGIGYTMERSTEKNKNRNFSTDNYLTATGDFIPIGISIGKTYFGFFELGASTFGFVKVGFGYRFNN